MDAAASARDPVRRGDEQSARLRRLRVILVFFTAALLLSGLTAFPLEAELDLLGWLVGAPPAGSAEAAGGLALWIATVRDGLHDAYGRYPWLAYGTDWLAFAHIVLAVLFIGPLRDPIRNLWVLDFGLIACVLVLPLALICGPFRGIPLGWRLVDCSFGVFGFLPLWLARRDALALAHACRRRRWAAFRRRPADDQLLEPSKGDLRRGADLFSRRQTDAISKS